MRYKSGMLGLITLIAITSVLADDSSDAPDAWSFKSSKAKLAKTSFDRRVAAAQDKFDQATKKAQSDLESEMATARTALQRELDEAMKQATQAGDLDDAVRIKKAKETIDTGDDLPTTVRLPDKSILLLGPVDPRSLRALRVGDDHAPYIINMDSLESAYAGLKEWKGRPNVFMTHPFERGKPCVMTRTIQLPPNRKWHLVMDLSHWNDWNLIVKANGETLKDMIVGPNVTKDGWTTVTVDLSKFAGKKLILELQNAANDWNGEQGVWGKVEIVSN